MFSIESIIIPPSIFSPNRNDQIIDNQIGIPDFGPELEPCEKKLLYLAIQEIKGQTISSDDRILIDTSTFVKAFGGDHQSAYNELTLACSKLFEREFVFRSGYDLDSSTLFRSRWVWQVAENKNEQYVFICFAISFIPILKKIEDMIFCVDSN